MSRQYFSSVALPVAALAILAGCSQGPTPSGAPLPPVSGAVRSAAVSASRPIATKTKTYIYVADFSGSAVHIYSAFAKNPKPTGTIAQGINDPVGIAIDKNGTLYVANAGAATITEYPAGQSAPSVTLRQDLPTVDWVAIDPSGNLWATNNGVPGNVVEFTPGSTSPSKTLTTGLSNPTGLAFDAAGNLYVANDTSSGGFIAEFPPGATSPSTTFSSYTIVSPNGVNVDADGNIYVGNYLSGEGSVFSHRSHKLIRTVGGPSCCTGDASMTIAANGRLYMAEGEEPLVNEFSRNGKVGPLTAQIDQDLQSAWGIAADPPAEP